jgi:hypothetical protein
LMIKEELSRKFTMPVSRAISDDSVIGWAGRISQGMCLHGASGLRHLV